MSFRLDKILRQIIECDSRVVRLGRNPAQASQRLILAKALAQLEACGDAMLTLDAKGRMCWKATPALRDRISDQRKEAEDEPEGEEV
jgi:hypothetical protein